MHCAKVIMVFLLMVVCNAVTTVLIKRVFVLHVCVHQCTCLGIIVLTSIAVSTVVIRRVSLISLFHL